ncbi:bifunctional diaminohydroxyphosphoribosylaminopyrimidine deaminase/5-amino-6-(5-phosphoribosylamino)uracil reductase RibD [Acidicapsa acidisoli]|uniref:bifunctional diaminohydroxyphosphoribosylaminopyrimidine deaminase/5-amino-6-(5-phosphoribosylamino)uracil reductase RibD n=1 Tax=Acidicapsa acidisoli TaxID=1615681 RepID=UPI0021E0E8EF|nr:bifunctional diaminohydroxyphosphoribosylaminopyrimidine deaminase/5-amino-6-(5-phosphoribosylamino)uracil reductase RibD [Acidicapsa acidisoli]
MTDAMAAAEKDTVWMGKALDLARHGIGLCSPNPVVGCVILDRQGEVAGEGWHEYDRLDHAEVVAIRAAGDRAKGGTAYVTLEPCNHTGRTGPCTQALITAGVARVVAATRDPNPLVAGTGLERLRQAGIAVEVGVCQAEAQRLNEGFARWIVSKRPTVEMKVAITLDGRIGPPPGKQAARQPYWITGEASRAAVQVMRWEADAVLTGVDTVIADDPMMTDRSGRPRRRQLQRVILDSALRMPLDAKLVTTAQDDVVLFTVSKDEARVQELIRRGVRVKVLTADSGRVPLGRVLDMLGADGIQTLLTETGTRLNTALLAAGLVDRLKVFCSPQIMGSDAVPAFRGLSMPVMLDAAEVERHGNDYSVSALLRDPWASAPKH